MYYNNRTNIENTGVIQQLEISFLYCQVAKKFISSKLIKYNLTILGEHKAPDLLRERGKGIVFIDSIL